LANEHDSDRQTSEGNQDATPHTDMSEPKQDKPVVGYFGGVVTKPQTEQGDVQRYQGERDTHDALVDRIKKSDRWMIVLTAIIALTGIIGLRILYLQGEADRPWLGSESITVSDITVNPVHADLTIVNAGRSPASISAFVVATGVAPTVPADLDSELANPSEPPARSILVPGQHLTGHADFFVITSGLLQNINSGSTTPFVLGRATYTNIGSGETHVTRICFQYSYTQKAWVFCDHYNDAD
jgi:hypothetical protein